MGEPPGGERGPPRPWPSRRGPRRTPARAPATGVATATRPSPGGRGCPRNAPVSLVPNGDGGSGGRFRSLADHHGPGARPECADRAGRIGGGIRRPSVPSTPLPDLRRTSDLWRGWHPAVARRFRPSEHSDVDDRPESPRPATAPPRPVSWPAGRRRSGGVQVGRDGVSRPGQRPFGSAPIDEGWPI